MGSDPGHQRDGVHITAGAIEGKCAGRQLKEVEKENDRLRKAVSDLTLEKLILKEAASGNF